MILKLQRSTNTCSELNRAIFRRSKQLEKIFAMFSNGSSSLYYLEDTFLNKKYFKYII